MEQSSYRNALKMTGDALVLAIRRAGSAKAVARMGNVSTRTAEKWQQGIALPSALALIKLMAASREVAQTILAATGLTDALMDAEEARLVDELIILRSRRELNGSENIAARASALGADVAERIAAAALKQPANKDPAGHGGV